MLLKRDPPGHTRLWTSTLLALYIYIYIYLDRKLDKQIHKLNRLRDRKNPTDIDTIYPTPPLGQDMTQGQFLSGV